METTLKANTCSGQVRWRPRSCSQLWNGRRLRKGRLGNSEKTERRPPAGRIYRRLFLGAGSCICPHQLRATERDAKSNREALANLGDDPNLP